MVEIELLNHESIADENQAKPEPEPEPEPELERNDDYEAYWIYQSLAIATGKALGASDANKSDTDRSPLAREYEFFKGKKNEAGQAIRDLPGTFGEYANHFEEPDGEYRELTHDELAEFGVEDDAMPKYPLWVPVDYELPSVWDEEPGDTEDTDGNRRGELVKVAEVREILECAEGVGPKSAEAILETLGEENIVMVRLG